MKFSKIILSLSFLIVGCLVTGTFAYLTDVETIQNTFATGNVQIELSDQENSITELSSSSSEISITKLSPGEYLPFAPVVTNVGENSCFLKAEIKVTNTGLASWLVFTDTENKWSQPVFIDGTATIYYQDILDSEETTTPMFTGVTLSEERGDMIFLEDMFLGEDNQPGFNLIIKATAVQTRYSGSYAENTQKAFEEFYKVHAAAP